MKAYKRIFVIVLDSLGIGALPDAARFGDRRCGYVRAYLGEAEDIGHSQSAKAWAAESKDRR